MKMMKRLKEQMAQLQEAAEERARQAEKDKVSTALLGLYWFIALTIVTQQQLSHVIGYVISNWSWKMGGKTNAVEEEDDVQRIRHSQCRKSKMYKSKIRHGVMTNSLAISPDILQSSLR